MVVGRINEKLLDHNCYQLKDYLIIIRLKPSKMSFVVKYTFLISPRSVSYTHLDVYKRQHLFCLWSGRHC